MGPKSFFQPLPRLRAPDIFSVFLYRSVKLQQFVRGNPTLIRQDRDSRTRMSEQTFSRASPNFHQHVIVTSPLSAHPRPGAILELDIMGIRPLAH